MLTNQNIITNLSPTKQLTYNESELVMVDPLPAVDGARVVPLGLDARRRDARRADRDPATF